MVLVVQMSWNMTMKSKLPTLVETDGIQIFLLKWTTQMFSWRTVMNKKIYQDYRQSRILSLRKRNLRIVICVTLSLSNFLNKENIVINADSLFVNFVLKILEGCQNKRINNTMSATTAITKWATVCSKKNWKTTFCKNRNWPDKSRNTFLFMRKSNVNSNQPKDDTTPNGKKKKTKLKTKKRKSKNSWTPSSRKKKLSPNKIKSWTNK